jgi:large subunit ribosomal protein L21
MFAVLKTGGKQYKVQAGDLLRVEKLAADAGEKVQFNTVLMLGGDAAVVGAPFVDGAAVQAEVVEQFKDKKVINFVKRRRKHSSKRTVGHRQQLTLIRVTDILASGADATGVKAAIGSGSVPTAAASAVAADDMTQLSGVGPAAAAKLTDAGITSFAQLAGLSEDAAAAIETVKIKPEWIAQAADLAK